MLCEAEGGVKVALIVDDIIGQQQVVIKSLEENFQSIEGIAGGTILGDGNVALILDAAGIAAQAKLAADQGQDNSAEVDEQTEHAQLNNDAQELLLFSTTPTDRFAIPMSLVSRIERVQGNG